MNLMTKTNVLILGGQSSVSQRLIPLVNRDFFNVYATYRGSNKVNSASLHTEWLYLDIADKNCIEAFLLETSKFKFGVILSLIGNTSNLDYKSNNKLVTKYLETYINFQSLIINELITQMNNGEGKNKIFINISSRSVSYGSFDVLYAQAKSAIDVLTKSLSKLYGNKIKFFNIKPGLIKESKMYHEMKPEVRKSHELRSEGKLLTIDQLCEFLIDFIESQCSAYENSKYDEVDIFIGPQYK